VLSGVGQLPWRVIRKEQEGVGVLVDLEKADKADVIAAIKDVLSQLED